jgi:hypothetical protein
MLSLYYARGDSEHDIVALFNEDCLVEFRRMSKDETSMQINFEEFIATVHSDTEYFLQTKVWNEKLLLLVVARYLLEQHFSHDFEFVDKIVADYLLYISQVMWFHVSPFMTKHLRFVR